MPTTQPLDEDDLGDIIEGQLKPIAPATSPQPSQAPRTPTPQGSHSAPTPQATTPQGSQSTQPRVYRPVDTHAPHFPTTPKGSHLPRNTKPLRTPDGDLSLRPTAPTPQAAPRHTPAEAAPIPTGASLTHAWKAYIEAHASQHLLVNAMRMATPTPLGNNTYQIAQSSVHLEYIRPNLDHITRYVRNLTGNGNITFTTLEISEDSPLCWNDRELLSHIIEKNPQVANFIKTLNLSLL